MPYKVLFVNPAKHYLGIRDEVLRAIDDVLIRGDLIMRRDVAEFEKKIARYIDTKYAISLNSGTDALFFALKAAGIGPGDEVITVSHTFVASVSAIVQTGAKPILVDVAEDFLMDMDKVEEAVTPNTKAIIPVHLNGRVCDMEKLLDIAFRQRLSIIEDAAQAMGAQYQIKREGFVEWRKAGSFGLAGCFSLYPFKVLGCFGDGGILTTNNDELAEKIRLLRDHGQKTKTELVCYGLNSRLDNLQAAILNVKFKYLDKWIERRQQIADLYNDGLEKIPGVTIPPEAGDNRVDIYQNYVLRATRRDELAAFLNEKGVETLIKDPIPLHYHPGLNLSHFHLPVSERLAKEVISLPVYPELDDDQVKIVIEAVKSFYL
ncbi:MAG: DegT/DnrJ/EryC1/StrS family aminotransferase [bacterium]